MYDHRLGEVRFLSRSRINAMYPLVMGTPQPLSWGNKFKPITPNKNENDLVSFSSNFVHYRQITVGGTFSSTKDNHKTALNYLSSGKINTELLISHKFNLSEFSKGIDVASSGNGLKIIINP